MEIHRIFVDLNNEQGLYAICISDDSYNEYEKTFDLWFDPEYILDYCLKYKNDIFGFFGVSRLEDFVEGIYNEAEKLEDVFWDFNENYLGKDNAHLQTIFTPFHNSEYRPTAMQITKTKLPWEGFYKKPALRMYSIRLSENAYVVTGGCIKLARSVQEIPACNDELTKINHVKSYLTSIECQTEDDLPYYYESIK